MPFCIGWAENFDKIAQSCTVKEIEANFCFSIFGKNLKFKMATIFGKRTIFENCLDTLWVKNFDKIALSRMVKEIEANLCFSILG